MTEAKSRADRQLTAAMRRWAAPPSRFLSLDGVAVHLRDEGPRDDPAPFVLLHGTGASLHSWDGWAEALGPARRVVRFDRPGFGLTGPDPRGDYRMAAASDFLLRLLDALDVGHCVLAGNSSGGRLAWEFAVRHPGRVARLILLAPGGYPRTTPLPAGLRLAMSPLGPLILRLLPRSAVAASLARSYGDPSKVAAKAVDRAFELNRLPGNRAALGETLRQAQAEDDADTIRDVSVPTLILWGTEDRVVPPADAERFRADIRGSRLVMLEGVGHLPQEEAPAETLAAVRAFLDQPSFSRS